MVLVDELFLKLQKYCDPLKRQECKFLYPVLIVSDEVSFTLFLSLYRVDEICSTNEISVELRTRKHLVLRLL
jgi:hypothetical protein